PTRPDGVRTPRSERASSAARRATPPASAGGGSRRARKGRGAGGRTGSRAASPPPPLDHDALALEEGRRGDAGLTGEDEGDRSVRRRAHVDAVALARGIRRGEHLELPVGLPGEDVIGEASREAPLDDGRRDRVVEGSRR